MKTTRCGPRLLGAALFLCLSSGLFAFELPKPSAKVTSFRLEAISLRDVSFRIDLAVTNPYPVPLSFDGMSLGFSVEGAKVFDTRTKGGFSVGAKSEKSSSFSVTLAYDAVIKAVKSYLDKDWLDTVVDGQLVIPIPKVPGLAGLPPSVSFSYRFERKIPAIKPQVSILDFTVRPPTEGQIAEAAAKAGKKLNPGKALGVFKSVLAGKKPAEPVIDPAELDVPLTVSYTMAIANEAKGPLSFDKLGYELYVNGERLVLGEGAKVVREGNRSLITVENVFSSKQLSKGVKALFSERRGRFEVKGKASMRLPAEISAEALPLAIDESGDFKLP